MTARKAIGIVRVSVVGDRDDEDKKDSFASAPRFSVRGSRTPAATTCA